MSKCPSADTLTTIASALDWDVEPGLQHLSTCRSCADQLRVIQTTHETFEESVVVSDETVARISHMIWAEAAQESVRARGRNKVGNVIEALLAGFTGVVVVSSGGVGVSSTAVALVFALVATAVFGYRVLASNQANASRTSAPSIQ